jgi:hypothetical protein
MKIVIPLLPKEIEKVMDQVSYDENQTKWRVELIT